MTVRYTGMDLALLARVRKTSIITGAVAAIFIATYWGINIGAAWLAGVAWALVNLYFTGEVVKSVITAEDRNLARILVAVFVKFPVLYAAGYLLLWIEQLPVIGLVSGFTWPFVVLVMKAAGRVYLKMDERSNGEGKSSRT